jgi:hypothetical protein
MRLSDMMKPYESMILAFNLPRFPPKQIFLGREDQLYNIHAAKEA